ncbi:hypothetical protein FS837_011446 [Tulasnella sp. UAMH 9824]|nr:hypothetical protein FS837_011446 [Tulasnella sp. UAMH 9824]
MASPSSPRSRAPKLSSPGFSRTGTSIEEDDPLWPRYALPETELPGRAQQDLHARVARQRETQSKANGSYIYATQLRYWAQAFQLPSSGSPAWMTLIRSRWLIIQTTSGHLQLWDIDNNSHDTGPTATFRGLRGLVDGFCISGGAGELVQLSISTMAYCVYTFVLDLPHRFECLKNKIELLPERSFAGWSGLKAAVEDVWAYTKRQGTTHQGFAYFDEPNAGRLSIGLACVDALAENQNVLDMQIRSDIILVARNWSIDFYDIQSLRTISHDAHGHHVTHLPFLKCYQSLPSPNPGFIHRANILPRYPDGLKNQIQKIFSTPSSGSLGGS